MEFEIKFDYDLGEEERQAAFPVLHKDVFTKHEQVPALENEFAKYIGTKYAVVTNTGTSALHCCIAALGITREDEVITVANQHTAPSFTVMLEGAKPVYVDCEEDTFNIDPTEIEAAITPNTKAIIPCHSNGHPYDCDTINEIAEKHDLIVIEDAAQSLGALYKGKLVGNFASLSIFSLAHHKHIMGAGLGGVAVTNNEILAEKIRRWRTSRYRGGITTAIDPVDKALVYQGSAPGFCYYLSEVHAAISRVQLKKFIDSNGSLNPDRKRALAKLYNELLEDTPVIVPIEKEYAHHTYLRYVIRAPQRDKLFRYLTQEKRIECFLHYPIPLYRSKFWLDAYGPIDREFPNTETVTKEVLTLPSWPQLTSDQVTYVVECIKEFYQK